MASRVETIKGMSGTAPYTAWVNMKAKCNKDRTVQGYIAYWEEFDNFWLSMRSTWLQGSRLVRKDPTIVYCPSNCVWQPNKGRPAVHDTNCASGIKGLSLITDMQGYKFWSYRTTIKGKRVCKVFSVLKYGEQKAYMLASIYARTYQNCNK